jgi:hypothetical protein
MSRTKIANEDIFLKEQKLRWANWTPVMTKQFLRGSNKKTGLKSSTAEKTKSSSHIESTFPFVPGSLASDFISSTSAQSKAHKEENAC